MFDVCVIAQSGTKLMPTSRVKARKLLKAGKAIIFNYDPFVIKLNYDVPEPVVQEIEVCMDTGSEHIGISVKSEKHEYVHLQADNLPNEKFKHDDRRKYRRDRRNRKRYRKCRFQNRRIPKGWMAPTVQHKKDNHLYLLKKYMEYMPVTRIVLEVGQFDPALMRAKEKGITITGKDYQQGTAYGMANVREAVFVRDNYTCQVCKRTPSDGVKLRLHHNIHRNKGGTDSPDNLAAVCDKCHRPSNHKPGKPLASGALGVLPPLKDAAFMNIVRWKIVEDVKKIFPDIQVLTTYGSYTKESRKKLNNLPKTHANDAYAMGDFHPKHRHREIHIVKRRRNNRVLCKFYDAKYIDIRDGEKKKASELGCNRTNRSVPRNGENNKRIYRGQKISKGKNVIRKEHYRLRPGDIIKYRGKNTVVKGVHCNGTRVMLETGISAKIQNVRIIRKTGGWQFLPV